MSDQPITLRAFLRDARWTLPLWVGTLLLVVLLDVGGMGDLKLIEALLIAVGGFIVLGPMTWLFWERAMVVGRPAQPPPPPQLHGGGAGGGRGAGARGAGARARSPPPPPPKPPPTPGPTKTGFWC